MKKKETHGKSIHNRISIDMSAHMKKDSQKKPIHNTYRYVCTYEKRPTKEAYTYHKLTLMTLNYCVSVCVILHVCVCVRTRVCVYLLVCMHNIQMYI